VYSDKFAEARGGFRVANRKPELGDTVVLRFRSVCDGESRFGPAADRAFGRSDMPDSRHLDSSLARSLRRFRSPCTDARKKYHVANAASRLRALMDEGSYASKLTLARQPSSLSIKDRGLTRGHSISD
jgi:hypothetical protein